MDSPLLRDVYMKGGREARSPGIATLKEAFDITYAVHRMEEEGARRKAYGAGGRGFLGGLNEDDEEEDETLVEEARRRKGETQTQSKGHSKTGSGSSSKSRGRSADNRRDDRRDLHDGRAGQRDRGRGREATPFELDMDGATLLGRRHKKGGIGGLPVESSPLARAPIRGVDDTVDAPQSPMHIG
jgi:serine/threonine-protein kinase RCK2